MIGLIFGETEFPKYILKKIKKKSKYLIIDLTKKKNFLKNIEILIRYLWSIWQDHFNTQIQKL